MNNITIQCDIPNDIMVQIGRKSEKEMINEVKRQVKNHMLSRRSFYSNSNYPTSDDAKDSDPLQEWVLDLVKEAIAENKDLIIEKAAHELATSMSRSKIVRERFADKLEETCETPVEEDKMESPGIQSAKPGVFFHGEEWYMCPHCGYGIEAQECIYERDGIKKVEGKEDVYICPQCNGMFRLPD